MKGILLIKNIANAHPERVHLLYQKYGIAAEVTPQTLALAIVAHGEPFIKDLAKIAVQNRAFLRIDGATSEVEKSWLNNFTSQIKEFFGIVSAGGEAWESIGHLFGVEQKLTAKEQAALNLELYRTKAENERIASQQKTMLYAVVGVAVFGILAVILLRK